MQFRSFVDIIVRIDALSSRNEITKILADLFSVLHADEIAVSCYLFLGTVYPCYKSTQFAIASKTMSKIIMSLCNIHEEDFQQALKQMGDYGDVLEQCQWHAAEATVSLLFVYNALVALEQCKGVGSQEQKVLLLKDLLKVVSAREAKYIVRIILGKLRLGFSEMTIIDALSWMVSGNKQYSARIEDAYNVCVDIGFIAKRVKNQGIDGLADIQVQLGVPIRPAAAERLPTAHAIIDKVGNCVAEPKFDGFRLQVHVNKFQNGSADIKFYSRNLLDMSDMFPDFINAFAKIPVESMICEGEAVSFDPNTGAYLPFQETVKRRRKHHISESMQGVPLKLFLFDLLYYNGESYLAKPFYVRRDRLASLVHAYDNDLIQCTQERAIDTAKQLQQYFIETIAAGLEGLVIKKINALYQPGKRNFNWIKLKRTSVGHLEDSIDVAILGYYAGKGKRAAFGIGAFLVGVYNHDLDSFQTIAKIGTGLSDTQWVEMKKRCDQYRLPAQPKNVFCHKSLFPDVWLEPMLVCQIFADEITASPTHTTGQNVHEDTSFGYSLRFPRFIAYRSDKNAYQTTGVDEIKHLYQNQYISKSKLAE